MNSKTKIQQLTVASLLLALAIASQFLKGFSVYITGPIINLILIIATMYCGIGLASIIAIITPITSFFITASPIIAAMPMIMPCIMIGNEILVLCIALLKKAIISLDFKMPANSLQKDLALLIPSMIIGSILKALFMSIAIVRIIIPIFGTSLPNAIIKAANVTFSVTQLTTSLIGGTLACIVWPIIKSITSSLSTESSADDEKEID